MNAVWIALGAVLLCVDTTSVALLAASRKPK
jgi:hypothetical protein